MYSILVLFHFNVPHYFRKSLVNANVKYSSVHKRTVFPVFYLAEVVITSLNSKDVASKNKVSFNFDIVIQCIKRKQTITCKIQQIVL